MRDNVVEIGTIVAALGSGIMAGLFFAFSVFVMTALAELPPAHGMAAMQSINVTILNPLFLLTFMGTAALSVLLAILALVDWEGAKSVYLLAGCAIYLVGGLLVTILFNVPRNNALAALDPNNAESVESWRRYISEWTTGNHVRTTFCLAATAVFIFAVR